MSEQKSPLLRDLNRIREMRHVAYMCFIDALTGLKKATSLVDERVQREGPAANYSMNSDLLDWSQQVWKQSNTLYMLDQIIESIAQEGIDKVDCEEKDVNLVVASGDSTSG
jgi:hypothetical protein